MAKLTYDQYCKLPGHVRDALLAMPATEIRRMVQTFRCDPMFTGRHAAHAVWNGMRTLEKAQFLEKHARNLEAKAAEARALLVLECIGRGRRG